MTKQRVRISCAQPCLILAHELDATAACEITVEKSNANRLNTEHYLEIGVAEWPKSDVHTAVNVRLGCLPDAAKQWSREISLPVHILTTGG